MHYFIDLYNVTEQILSKFITLLLNFLAFYYPFKVRRADGKHFFCDLPYVARRTMSGFLDYKTRSRLRKISARTREIVDDLPLQIPYLCIETTQSYISFQVFRDGVKVMYNTVKNDAIEKWVSDENSKDEVDEKWVERLKEVLPVILTNRSLRIKTLAVEAYFLNDLQEAVAARKIRFVLKVVSMVLKSLNRPLWVQEFEFYCRRNVDDVLYVLPYLKPKYLKKITVKNDYNRSTDWRKMVSLNQWKEAEYIFIHSPPFRFPINAFQKNQIYERNPVEKIRLY